MAIAEAAVSDRTSSICCLALQSLLHNLKIRDCCFPRLHVVEYAKEYGNFRIDRISEVSVTLYVQDSLPAVGQTLPDGIRTHWAIKEISKITRPYPNLPAFTWRHVICG
ncbi:MAG: hypothetical protein JW976_14690 [Syntrophaceae bacterium]|nr:hypothetical protein [Syntrophaceae bacterium]